MDERKTPETRENVFRRWVGFTAGQWWPDRKAMGEAIDKAYRQYSHYSVTPGNNPEEAARKAREGAEEFLRLTGYTAEDFQKYLYSLPPPSQEETK